MTMASVFVIGILVFDRERLTTTTQRTQRKIYE